MKSPVSESSDVFEQEADRIAALVTGAVPPNPPGQPRSNGPAPFGGRVIQRAAIKREPSNPHADAAIGRASTNVPEPSAGERLSGRLIVEDDSREIGSGQMRKTEFLNQLERAVCESADQELARVGRNTQGCPYIERWIGYYRMRSSQHIERALFRYAPEAASATSAHEYIPIVAERIKRAVTVWATTGQITGVPEELADQIGAGGLLGAAAGVLAGIGGAVTGAIGSIGRAIGGIFTKAKDGGPRKEADPDQVQSQLGSGQPLDSGVKQRMESAFGHSFSNVRVHNDAGAAELSESLNARAFTLGEHLAFGAGQYRPGTIVGDALIAHELAHVVQQRGGTAGEPSSSNDSNAFEADADRSAAGALISMWSGAKGAAKWISQTAVPRLRSGLRLQRCGPTLESKGTVMHRGTVFEGTDAGVVEVRFGDAVKDSGLKQNLVGLEYTGPNAEKFKWLQFVWMEALAGEVPVKGRIPTSGILGSIETTTDRANPLWKVDASARTSEPFYDSGGLAIRSSAAITMFDKPLESGAESQARDILDRNPGSSSATIADHFETYLMWGGRAIYRVQWLARITYEPEDKTKALKTKGTRYEFLSAQRVEGLPETLRKILLIQFPQYGKAIAPGVADGEPKYEGPLVTPEDAESKTLWELSRLPATALRPSIAKKSNLRPEDYSRAAGFIRRLFDKYGVTYDVERQRKVLGRVPKPEEQSIVDRWLADVLAVKDVRKSVTGTGGRGLPVAPGSSAPSLVGHVRIFNDVTEYSIKRFQLQRLVAQEFDVELKDVDKRVQSLWGELGIQPEQGYTITEQERWASSLIAYRGLESSTPGFYYPSDDVFYLALSADLTKPETKALASHETVHLLGGRQKTLDAFAAKFGRPGFIEYWRPFEEGMAERIALESLYPGKENESLAAKTDSQYKDFVELVEAMMAGGKRQAVFQAYFTGNIPDFIFDFLREKVAKKPGAQQSGGESGSKKESEKGAASK